MEAISDINFSYAEIINNIRLIIIIKSHSRKSIMVHKNEVKVKRKSSADQN
jgi:hypothetical protein